MPSRREDLRRGTRSRVLDAAGRLFEQRGFAATTIRDIAEASGVSVGSVMAAGDKTTLLVQVFDGLIAAEHEQHGASRPMSVSDRDLDCVERIMRLVKPFVTIFTTRQQLARTYASILVSGVHSSMLFTSLADRLIAEIRVAIEESTHVTAEHASATASAVYFAYIGTLFSWSARSTADPSELATSLRSTFAAICITKG